MSLLIEHKEKDGSRIDWRRSKVQELSSQGHSQREIAQILQVSNGTVNRDLSYLRQQVKSNIRKYIDERLPEEYEKRLVTLYSKISKSKLLMLLCLVFSLSLIAKYIKFSIDNKC